MAEANEISKLQNDLERALTELKNSRAKLQIFQILCVICVAVTLFIALGYFSSISRGSRSEFTFYYAEDVRQRYGVDDLESYLDRWQWVEGVYVANKFDCSEMSACIERRLENEGYHALIVAGKCPWDASKRHAWLLVETTEGKYMPVEATNYRIVKWADPHFDSYFVYDHEFETIQDALAYNYDEYDWWNN